MSNPSGPAAGTGLLLYGKKYLTESDAAQNIQARTQWFAFSYFPLYPIASYRIAYNQRPQMELHPTGRLIEQIPLQWSQIFVTWGKAIACVLTGGLVLYLYVYFHTH
jgi:hypothetical protein